jgi:hypothetical protein
VLNHKERHDNITLAQYSVPPHPPSPYPSSLPLPLLPLTFSLNALLSVFTLLNFSSPGCCRMLPTYLASVVTAGTDTASKLPSRRRRRQVEGSSVGCGVWGVGLGLGVGVGVGAGVGAGVGVGVGAVVTAIGAAAAGASTAFAAATTAATEAAADAATTTGAASSVSTSIFSSPAEVSAGIAVAAVGAVGAGTVATVAALSPPSTGALLLLLPPLLPPLLLLLSPLLLLAHRSWKRADCLVI